MIKLTIKVGTILVMIFGVFLGLSIYYSYNGLKDSETYYDRISYLENAHYDFKVFSPLESQVDEIQGHSSVQKVLPFYKRNSQISLYKKSESNHIVSIIAHDSYDFEMTEFSQKRLMLTTKNESTYESIYLDYKTVLTLDVSLGDLIDISMDGFDVMTFHVTSIYESFNYYSDIEGTVLFFYTDYVKEKQKTEDLKLSGIYIQSNNIAATRNYLKESYIPLGNMLPNDERYFSGQLEYDLYVERFINDNRGNLVSDKAVLLTQAKQNNENLMINEDRTLLIAPIVLLLGTLGVFIKLLFARNHQKETKQTTAGSTYNRSAYRQFYISLDLFSVVLLCVSIFVFKILNQSNVINQDYLNQLVLRLFLAVLIPLLISFFASVIITRNRGNK